MFFDFSCAFDTRCLALLGEKLQVDSLPCVSLGCELPNWYVLLENCEPDRVVSHTGAPLGTVLSPSLFTVYDTDFNHHQKVANASACDDDEYRTVVGTCEHKPSTAGSEKDQGTSDPCFFAGGSVWKSINTVRQ